jgi:hypothetical protein
MPDFSQCLRARGTDRFSSELKNVLLGLAPGVLPLQQGASQGGHVDDSDLDATVLDVTDDKEVIKARVGIFFTEVIGNCACGDEPVPAQAYCVLQVNIDIATAMADFTVLAE